MNPLIVVAGNNHRTSENVKETIALMNNNLF